MVQFSGVWSVSDMKLVTDAHVEVVKRVALAVAAAQSDTDQYKNLIVEYFGQNCSRNKIDDVVESMSDAISNQTYRFKKGPRKSFFNQEGGSTTVYGESTTALIYSDADHPNMSYIQHVKMRIAQRTGAKGNKATLSIKLGDDFFNEPWFGDGNDERIKIILHELSHHAANTQDETMGTIELYGPLHKLAKVSGQADNNAENYAYFLSAFA